MSARERLHRVVDLLPEADVGAALRFLDYLWDAQDANRVLRMLMTTPEDKEPLPANQAASLDRVREEAQRGNVKTVAHS